MPRGELAREDAGRRSAKETDLWTGWDRGNFPIDNPWGLARVLDTALERRWPGWDGRGKSDVITYAAEEIGISYTSLWRLVHAESEVLRWDAVRRLQQWLTKEEWKSVEKHLFSSEVRRKRREYLAYLDRETRRYTARRTRRHDILFTPGVETIVSQFAHKAKRFPRHRVELAKFRVFDPIVGWVGLRETLDESDVLTLVKQGFKREATLLKKEAEYLKAIL